MRILVSVCHPADVRFFGTPIATWTERGDEVLVVARDKDCTVELAKDLDLRIKIASRAGRRGLLGLGVEFIVRLLRLSAMMLRYRPDIVVSRSDPAASQAAFWTWRRSITYTDSDQAWLQNMLGQRFATVICNTPHERLRFPDRTVTVNSHPTLSVIDSFVPDDQFRERMGVPPNEKLIAMRLVEWSANHDVGHHGILELEKLCGLLKEHGRVVISHERPLPEALRSCSMTIPPKQYQQLIYHADLVIAEGAAAMEAGFLGTPNVFRCTISLPIWEAAEEAGLMLSSKDEQDLINKCLDILADDDAKPQMRSRSKEHCATLCNMSEFTVKLVDAVSEMGRRAIHELGEGNPTKLGE